MYVKLLGGWLSAALSYDDNFTLTLDFLLRLIIFKCSFPQPPKMTYIQVARLVWNMGRPRMSHGLTLKLTSKMLRDSRDTYFLHSLRRQEDVLWSTIFSFRRKQNSYWGTSPDCSWEEAAIISVWRFWWNLIYFQFLKKVIRLGFIIGNELSLGRGHTQFIIKPNSGNLKSDDYAWRTLFPDRFVGNT